MAREPGNHRRNPSPLSMRFVRKGQDSRRRPSFLSAVRWRAFCEDKPDPKGRRCQATLKNFRRMAIGRGYGQVDGITWEEADNLAALAAKDGTRQGCRTAAIFSVMSDALLRVSEGGFQGVQVDGWGRLTKGCRGVKKGFDKGGGGAMAGFYPRRRWWAGEGWAACSFHYRGNPARRPLTEEEGSMKTMILAAVLAVALMLAGCGGGSKGGTGAGMPSTQTPTPTTPPTRVIEPPLVSRGGRPSWGELPALVDRMNHRAELGSSCDDGVAACQAVVKGLLANVGRKSAYDEIIVDETHGTLDYDQVDETRGTFRSLQVNETHGTFYFGTVYRQSQRDRNHASHWSGWLENSIFIYTYDTGSGHTEDLERVISMGIRDTNPVTGVYRGRAIDRKTAESGNFELTYTSGATGGQLDFTVNGLHTSYRDEPSTYTWTNVSVDNEGYFDNGITPNRQGLGAHKLEGSFYQGGEVGGVFSYRKANTYTRSRPAVYHGVFGGKLVPDTP